MVTFDGGHAVPFRFMHTPVSRREPGRSYGGQKGTLKVTYPLVSCLFKDPFPESSSEDKWAEYAADLKITGPETLLRVSSGIYDVQQSNLVPKHELKHPLGLVAVVCACSASILFRAGGVTLDNLRETNAAAPAGVVRLSLQVGAAVGATNQLVNSPSVAL